MNRKVFIASLKTLLAGLVLSCAWQGASLGQAYPSRPLKLVNPWPSGGPADVVARLMGDRLSAALGQPVVVDNIPGAGAMIGTAAVAKAPADGYTLLFSHVGPMAISPHLQTSMAYDPVKDFAAITQLTSSPLVLLVRADLPIRSLGEFLGYAKANPGKLNMGSIGPGSTPHLSGELMRSMAGVTFVHVPYKGSAPLVTDMLGGQIDFAFLNIGGVQQQIDTGKLRALGMTSLKRSPLVPQLPAISEAIAGYEVNSWFGMAAPAGTPRPVIERLNAEFVKILKLPDVLAKLNQMGYDVDGTTPEQHAAKVREDLAKWSVVIKATGLPRQ